MKKNSILIFLLLLTISTNAFTKKKKNTKKLTNTTKLENNGTEINWLSFTDAQEKMKTNPKKVYIDIYTDWCGWCKVMEKKTFTNPTCIKYMNENFYAIRFNAEKDNNILFQNKTYNIEGGNNKLAVELMRGKLSYPTSIIMEENFANPQPIPGYLDLENMEVILHFIASNSFKSIPFEEYKKNYSKTW